MATILQHFQKVTSREEKASCPKQLVAVAKRWTGHMEGLLTNHMPSPCIVMTVPEEAAVYGDVQQVSHCRENFILKDFHRFSGMFLLLQIILMTLESSKISVLLGVLDFNPDVGQKTLIVTNSSQEVEDVFKVKQQPELYISVLSHPTVKFFSVFSHLQAVSNKSAFCLKTHQGLTHQFDSVVQQWRKNISPGTHVILGNLNISVCC